MKAKSALVIAFLAIAIVMTAAIPKADAQCCWTEWVAAPFVAAGAVVVGAGTVVVGAVGATAAVVSAPFTAFSCGTCGVTVCNPCAAPPVAYVPPCDYC